jgi:hypothetical protein
MMHKTFTSMQGTKHANAGSFAVFYDVGEVWEQKFKIELSPGQRVHLHTTFINGMQLPMLCQL